MLIKNFWIVTQHFNWINFINDAVMQVFRLFDLVFQDLTGIPLYIDCISENSCKKKTCIDRDTGFLDCSLYLYYDTFSSFFMTEKINPAAISVRTIKIAHTCQIGILS